MLWSLVGHLGVVSATMLAPLLHPDQASPSGHNPGVPQVRPAKEDLARYNVTRVEKDKGALKTFEEVVDFMNE